VAFRNSPPLFFLVNFVSFRRRDSHSRLHKIVGNFRLKRPKVRKMSLSWIIEKRCDYPLIETLPFQKCAMGS
jgi:hypothetical protein